MTEQEKRELAKEIAEYVKADLCEATKCPLGLTASDAMRWQGMLKVAGIVGVAAAWTIVATTAAGCLAALWAGIRYLISSGGLR